MKLLIGRLETTDVDVLLSEIDSHRERHGVTIQAFDAAYIAGERHLECALRCADRSIARGENVARDRAVEILLYAAGRRQIDRALEMGVSDETAEVVVLLDDPAGSLEAEREAETALVEADWIDTAGNLAENSLEVADRAATIREFFDVSERELAATDAPLEELVRERVVLLEIEK